ncbi:MAG: flagellin [Lachnospiraceae bacterium]|nr:flagellin [Lachnospiraceae bacterium]
MVVQNNLTAMNSNRMLGITVLSQAKSTEKLSSGYRINRAADDAAGLAISEKMRRQVRGLTQATANAQDGISALQTAEGALNEVHAMLQRMNELAIKAGNETLQSLDRSFIQSELVALRTEIDRVAATTTFNEQMLLDGNFSGGKRVQVGAETATPNQIMITIAHMNWTSITRFASEFDGVQGRLDVMGSDDDAVYQNITETVDTIKSALKNVSTIRSDMGAVQNRLEHTVANLRNVVENTTAAESAIRDTDMATEMVKFSNNSILAQAGQAMLAQANQANAGVLALL